MLRKTQLFEIHIHSGAKMVEFAGWEMPLHYGSIINEVKATREKAGLFDISHMGTLRIKGKSAQPFLEKMLPRKIEGTKEGRAIYSFLLNENGGFIDDLIVYKLTDRDFFLCVNAVNTRKDFEWLSSHAYDDVEVENLSEKYSLISLQGPEAEKIAIKVMGLEKLASLSFYSFLVVEEKEPPFIIARTGYTGEDGFEFFYPEPDVSGLWKRFLKEGASPCGLGARDTLRIEAGYPLYGQELKEDITPYEAGMERFVNIEKNFIGKEGAQRKQKTLIYFKIKERTIPRNGMEIWNETEKVGQVTSGTYSPTLNVSIGMGYVKIDSHTHLFLEVRGKKIELETVSPPFVPYRVKRKRR